MRKTKLLEGTYGVYVVYDKISKHYKANFQKYSYNYLPTIVTTIALRELTIFKIGIFNDVTGELKNTTKKRINTDCYFFPHSRLSPNGENITHEEVEKVVTETKNKIIAESNTSNEEKGE